MKPKRIVLLADGHNGSRYALAHPDQAPRKGKGAKTRAVLWDIWKTCAAGEWGKPDAIIYNGDAVDGQNPRGRGVGQWTTDLDEQADGAAELIKMWMGAKTKIYMIRGSDYHVESNGLNVEEHVAQKLGAEPYPGGDGERSGWHWFLTFGSWTFHVQHYVGATSVAARRSTPLATAMLNVKLHEDIAAHKARVTVRAHAHNYVHTEYSNTHGFILPCWKAKDAYMLKGRVLAYATDIGFVGIEIRGDSLAYDKQTWKLDAIQPKPHTVAW